MSGALRGNLRPPRKPLASLAALVLFVPLLAGCSNPFSSPGPEAYTDLEGYVLDPTGRNATAWPDLEGVTITILDNGAFLAFDDAAKQFELLTGVKVKKQDGDDTVVALKELQRLKKSGKVDVVYGLDNMVLQVAVRTDDLVAYRPQLANRIDPSFVFFAAATNATWFATPTDHGYIAINIAKDPALDAITDLNGVLRHAEQFVTEDPRVSSPGLGFLLVTIATYKDNPDFSTALYDWEEYWKGLLRGPDRDLDGASEGCVLVAHDWTEAYEQHFSAGYGADPAVGGMADKDIVVSYTESPAYEAFAGMSESKIARVLYNNGTTYHQIQTTAIANGTKNLHAAQAWVEFTLTDFYQELAAPKNAVYPVVPSIKANTTYAGLDPAPGSFQSVQMDPDYVADNLDGWLKAWGTLYEDSAINCKLGSGA